MDNAQKTILVTGGAGFVGSHLCKKLAGMGHQIICLDDFSTGRESNIKDLVGQKKFQLVRASITKKPEFQIDEIYNLASPASPKAYQKDPVNTLMTNVLGTYNLLELAKEKKAAFLQASTSEVYGNPLQHPQKETYWGNVNPTGLRSCYDEGKRAAETLCMDFFRQHELKIKIARIFNTYGPNMDAEDGRVVSDFIVQALRNLPLTVYGDGAQSRSFQYVDDLVEGLIALMEHKDADFTGPVNLGNPNEFTINELADLVLKLLPESKSQKTYAPLPSDDPIRRQPDITLAKEKLNWQPKIELKEGLIKTIEYFKSVI